MVSSRSYADATFEHLMQMHVGRRDVVRKARRLIVGVLAAGAAALLAVVPISAHTGKAAVSASGNTRAAVLAQDVLWD
jgi:hypothetical protein